MSLLNSERLHNFSQIHFAPLRYECRSVSLHLIPTLQRKEVGMDGLFWNVTGGIPIV